jgi:hypothetical protein
MWQANPFTFYFAGIAGVMALSLVVGRTRRAKLADWAARFERRTHLNAVILLCFAAYGLARLAGYSL